MTSRNAAHNQVNVIHELTRMMRASRKRAHVVVMRACLEVEPGERKRLFAEANGHARWATRCEGWLFEQTCLRKQRSLAS